ncbi:uncharacterized [Tachysurus ichikawai]
MATLTESQDVRSAHAAVRSGFRPHVLTKLVFKTHQCSIIKSNQVVLRCSPHADTKRQRRVRPQPTKKTNALFDERTAPRSSSFAATPSPGQTDWELRS